ncbi:hypothetical protein BVC80_479g22 [Macleaya cordata]|uniref:Uncharacterized protein n=1 Tax=Macleaya cordata TaxID=56857 RepID=A0A200Q7N6_MACCD|nr:hypothetical protein BVC80_479g22 [Macleaya cordata]
MAGLLAWAADVVGGSGQSNDEDESNQFPAVVFTPEQHKYARELEQKSASLRRSIQDLRQRIPPPNISQSLPHLHAHSLASNAALALQLNAHSSTREEAQFREITLQEENSAYEKAILNCEKKIQEKLQEADLLQMKLKEMDTTEKNLRTELEKMQATLEVHQSGKSLDDPKITEEAQADVEASKSVILDKLDAKRKELNSVEDMVQDLEKKWAQVQHNSLRQPSPAQREKILDKQLHSLIEQLAAKQSQAEGLVSENHVMEQELERLNAFRRRLDSGNVDLNMARNRSGRSSYSVRGSSSADYIADTHLKPTYIGGRTESQQRLMLLRSAFVLYILVLHILVFIKISF